MKKALSVLLIVLFLFCVFGCSAETDQQTSEPTTATEALYIPHVEGWELTSREESALTDGVQYLQLHFADPNGQPHVVYALMADPQRVTLHTGTNQNELSLIPTGRQNVLEQMKASVSDGLPVVAAVNGDFFAIESTFMPTGLSIKNGIVLKENTGYRPFCAVTKDGQYLVSNGKTDKVDLRTLEMAVGGSHVLVKDGSVLDVEQTSTLSTVSHPRTLSGVRDDGTILLVVIDGRQAEHSNGATLSQCARLMHSLGAVQAINHDGGGSSTMVLRSDDTYTVANSPSDGSLRQVYCSIQLVLKY